MTTKTLRAGAGRAEIVLPAEVWPLDGFTAQHDALFSRVLVLEQAERRLVLAVLDQTALPADVLDAVGAVIAAGVNAAAADVLVGVSHTFNAPHIAADHSDAVGGARMRIAFDALLGAVDAATREAVATLRAAHVDVAEGTTDVGVNRDVETSAGWALGVNPAGHSDPALPVVRIVSEQGEPIAVLVNAAVQPSAMQDDAVRAQASGDLAGRAMAIIEERMPGATAFFLIGAAGDQAPRPVGNLRGAALAEALAERLAEDAARALELARPVPVEAIRLTVGAVTLEGQQPVERLAFAPTRSHVYEPAPERQAPFWVLRLGPVALIGVQVELSAASGARLREASAGVPALVVTMMNGAAKYLPPADAFDRMTYEALSSRYARGSAEILESAIAEELRAPAAELSEGA